MNERQNKILTLLAKEKKMEVAALSQLLGVSQVTIRKDLDQLENRGLVVRNHGFARLNDSDDINQRLAMHYDIKHKIAGAACQLIENGETVMVESGSCCALLALEIAKTKKDVTIITNSAFIGEYIRKSGDCKIVLLGGQYQREAQVMVGPMTRKCAELFFVDKLFIGIDGFMAESGFTGNDFMRCEVVRDMAKQANTVIVVSDSSKFSQKGTVRLLTMSEVSYVFTDDEILPEHEQILIESGIQVVKVKKD
ncbi:DeoR/GlpR transcriptional regulator [[Clostridium] spiroforme]|nr:DeoR/GlpR transcriptional regulator [Thomasclavelia spiroformis]MBM6881016.1 DeoR/GlpR transcriptional regulator [Thomasclavelia spiroformis]